MNIHDDVGEAVEIKPASKATKPPSPSVGLPQVLFKHISNHNFPKGLPPAA
jgi:hypothetical protein